MKKMIIQVTAKTGKSRDIPVSNATEIRYIWNELHEVEGILDIELLQVDDVDDSVIVLDIDKYVKEEVDY